MLFLAGVGFTSSLFQAVNTSMTMTASAPEYHGRVMSINQLNVSLTAFGTFVTGYVVDWAGDSSVGPLELASAQVTFLGIGVIMIAFLLLVTLRNPSYRHLQQEDLKRYAAEPSRRPDDDGVAAAPVGR